MITDFIELCKRWVVAYGKIRLSERMTYDQLLDIIEKGQYEVGKPSIVRQGIVRSIRFREYKEFKIQVMIADRVVTIRKMEDDIRKSEKINKDKRKENIVIWKVTNEMKRVLEQEGLVD